MDFWGGGEGGGGGREGGGIDCFYDLWIMA